MLRDPWRGPQSGGVGTDPAMQCVRNVHTGDCLHSLIACAQRTSAFGAVIGKQ